VAIALLALAVGGFWLMLRSERAAALVSHLSLYLVLPVTLRHVGIGDTEVGWAQVLFVFATARFRALTWLLPVPLGLVTSIGWRWRQQRRTAPGPVAGVR
jgi:hypothetical protein